MANQSHIQFFSDSIIKTYKKRSQNNLSSVANELYAIDKFSMNGQNPHTPIISEPTEFSYRMERYDVPFGKGGIIIWENIKRILFTISKEELFRQLDIISNFLKTSEVNHRDINPGNLLFFEKEKIIKLIDFYWATTKETMVPIPSKRLNRFYGLNDQKALAKLKNQIEELHPEILESVKPIKENITKTGKPYYDGSSRGRTYHKLSIPCFDDIAFHKNTETEFLDILNSLDTTPKSIIDVGCASGYNTFNMMRQFRLSKAVVYEADPVVFVILNDIKKLFTLKELVIKGKINKDTLFEKVDLTLCMNVHMWLYKQLGDEVDIVMKRLIESSNTLFFQTAGKESSGRMRIKKFKSKEDIYNYLVSLSGSKKVTFIRSTKMHGLRHLFKIGA